VNSPSNASSFHASIDKKRDTTTHTNARRLVRLDTSRAYDDARPVSNGTFDENVRYADYTQTTTY